MLPGLGKSKDRQVSGFSAAAGEDNLRGAASQQRCHRLARALNRRPCLLSMMVDGRRVAEVLPEISLHGLKDRGQHGRGGVVVEIDAAHGYLPFYAVYPGGHRNEASTAAPWGDISADMPAPH